MKIGIIGQGFVGNAVYQKFKNYFDILTYDIDETKCNSDFHYIKKGCDIIFLCLPTPMYEDGTCNTSIVEIMLSQINGYGPNKSYDIVIKSTIPPGTTEEWNERFEKLNIVFNPEFLTEANAVSDYENQNRIILGGPRPATTRLKRIFTKVFPKAHIIKTGSRHAEMVKYVTNAFLATKVSFANEMYQICQALDIDYDKVIEYAQHDDRLGTSHWAVPGPDGDFGYGGHCFPKDVKALISLANKYSLDPKILTAVDSKNNDVRNDRDWEKMKGRAIT